MKATPAVRRALEARVETITEELTALREERRELQEQLGSPKSRPLPRKANGRPDYTPRNSRPSPVRDAALAAVKSHPGSSAYEICERDAGLSKRSVYGALYALEALGEVRRVENPEGLTWEPLRNQELSLDA